jgi:tRNA A37 threonylcarbamoyladenosine biosynthesis protein TsaE
MPLFEEAEKKFTQHLLIENNDRIIFSGKFGHGKTTFLKEFFREDNQKLNLNGINFKIILYIQ